MQTFKVPCGEDALVQCHFRFVQRHLLLSDSRQTVPVVIVSRREFIGRSFFPFESISTAIRASPCAFLDSSRPFCEKSTRPELTAGLRYHRYA